VSEVRAPSAALIWMKSERGNIFHGVDVNEVRARKICHDVDVNGVRGAGKLLTDVSEVKVWNIFHPAIESGSHAWKVFHR